MARLDPNGLVIVTQYLGDPMDQSSCEIIGLSVLAKA